MKAETRIAFTHPTLLTVLALTLLLAACHGNTPRPSDAPLPRAIPVGTESIISPDQAVANVSDESLYLLDAVWSDQSAQPMQLVSLRGKPVILSMIFTRCGWACPTIVQDMKKIAGHLPEHVQNDVRYVLVSMDPERDTPDVLAGFARTHQLDAARWTLLRGESTNVRQLAALLGIRYRKESSGQFSHTNMITILNEEGEIVHVHRGLESDPTDTVDKLQNLLAGS